MKVSSSNISTFTALLAITLLTIFVGAELKADAEEFSTKQNASYRVISFDEAMKDQLLRSMPLKLAFPEQYEMLILNSKQGVIWASPDDLAEIKRTDAAPKGGYFHGRLTPNIGYDERKNSFICGPNCSEEDMVSKIRQAARDVKVEKYAVNCIPIILIEMDTSNMKDAIIKKLYMAYIATLIDTNVWLISYRPPSNSDDDGGEVWAAFKKALTESKQPCDKFDNSSQACGVDQPGWQTGEIGKSLPFRRIADEFIAAAVAGDAAKTARMISPNTTITTGGAGVERYLADQVLPFFAQFTIQETERERHGHANCRLHRLRVLHVHGVQEGRTSPICHLCHRGERREGGGQCLRRQVRRGSSL
jgi:hypothetical protein